MASSSAQGARRAPVGRLLKWLGVVCLAVVVLLVIVLGALHTPPGRRFVMSRVTGLLASRQIEFNADQLRYNLFDLSIDLRDVTIRSARRADDPPFAVIRHLTADLSLFDLLRGRYVVESATADGARVHYLVDENGDNLPRPPSDPNAPDEPLDYLIADLTITGADVRYDDRVQQIDATLPVRSLTISGDRTTDRHDIALVASDGRVLAQGRDVRLASLAAELELGDDDVEIARATLDAEGSRVELSGTVERFAEPVVDARVRATLDAARAAQLAGVEQRAAGRVSIDGTAKGPASAPDVQARIEGRGLAFRTLESLSLDAEIGYDGETRQVTARSLNAAAPWGRITGNGQVSLEQGPSRATLRASGLDLATLMRGLGVEQTVASRLDAGADLRWPALDYAAASGSADLTLRPTRSRASRSTMPVGGRVAVRGDGTRLVARLHDLAAAGARVDGQVTLVGRERLDGGVRATIADVGATAAAAEAFLGRAPGAMMSDRVAGALGAQIELGGTIANPAADASIEAPALEVDQAGTLSLASRLRYTPAMVTLDAADVTWGQARAHAAGRIGLERGQPLDLRFDVGALEVPALLALAGQDPASGSGTLSLHGSATGTLTSPGVAATMQGTNLVAAGEPLGTLDVEAGLDGRELTVSRLALDKPQPDGNGHLTATGTYHLDTRAYTFDLQSSDLRLVNVALPDGRKVAGRIALEGRGAGTVAAPAGSIRAALTGVRLAEHELGDVRLTASAANQRADVDLSADRFGLQSKAVIDLTPSYPATIDARIDNLDLARLPVELQTPLTGRLSASATSSLELTRPAMARVNATIDAFEGRWNEQPFALQGPAVLGLADERIAIDRLTLTARDSTVSVRGTLPINMRRGEGDLAIDARANLETLARYAPADSGITASGALQLAGTIRGNLEFVDPDLQLTIDNAAFTTPQLGAGVTNLTARARVAGGVAALERLAANWSQATIEAAGTVPLDLVPSLPVEIPRRGGPASFRAAITGLDPATLPGAPEDLTGLISVTVNGEAARPDLASLDATLTFPELRVSIRDLDLAQQQPSTVRVAAGQATIDRFSLAGSAGTLDASGTVGLTGERPIDVRVDGDFNTAAAASFTDAFTTEGRATLALAAAGTIDDPRLSGAVALTDVNLAVDQPEIAAEGLDARIDLADNRLTLTSLTADVNGGTLTGSGGLTYRDGQFDDVKVELSAKGIAFDAPLDLRSLSDSSVTITEEGDDGLLVAGKVVIREAGLTGDINFDTGLLATLGQPRALDLTEERNPLLERVNFNVQVVTAAPILIDNNLARAEIRTNLRVLGTPYETGLSGTMTMLEGGEIMLNERRYQVERAAITFLEERRIVPSFDLRLYTDAGNYDVTLEVTGEPGDTETVLTSNPSLPEPDIMALLVTGRTLEEMRGEEGDIAKEQVLSRLAGRVGSRLGSGLEKATGLSDVRLEPNLIASETDPSARLTVGQDITDDLKLIFSTDLADSNDSMWIARYDVTRRFQTNAVRQPDNSYRLDFRHDVRFGGRPSPSRQPRERPRVTVVEVAPDGVLGEAELRDRFGFEPGDEFDYFAARDRVDGIEAELQKRGRLESRVRVDREEDGDSVALNLRVDAGPVVRISYEGMQPPGGVDEEVRRQWNRGVFDSQRAGDAGEALREWLISERYLNAEVAHRVEDTPEGRQVFFSITPGTRFERIEMQFAGAKAIDPDTLDDIVDEQDLERQLFTDPVVVTELLRRYYREEGFLSAEIDEPKYEYEGNVARAVLEVREGPRFTIRSVSVTGNTVVQTPQLLRELPTVEGDPFLPRAAEAALERTRQLYWDQAYNDMRSEYSLVLDPDAGTVAVAFEIEEGPKSVIADLTMQGNRKTSDRLVSEQLEIAKGQPLDLSALGRSRRNLYDTGAFSMVDITREPIVPEKTPAAEQGLAGPGVTASTALAPAATDVKPVRVDVNLREVQPVQLRYGVSYDTERGLGGVLDVANRNSLGKARVLGLSGRYDSSLREGRLYLTQPSLLYWPVSTTAAVYYREERNPATNVADPFNVDRLGLSIQQERKLANSYVWSYGYRWERARKFDPIAGVRGDWIVVSPLTSTFTRETRDEVLDATRGSFTSHGLSYSPTWLGGDDSYIKYYGQYFHYFPLQPERRKRFTNEILRPRFVYATGIRVGLARGFGARVPETERFYAGGSTTLRGFEQNAVGPIGPDGIPTGGEALLVFNNEVRFPLIGMVDGVGFLDIGNVFDELRDIDFSDIRETAGIGVRLRTPWFLVRGDYGFVLDRRPGERRSRFYFSIGQAF